MPIDYKQYPKDWKVIRATILERAAHCCEGSPMYPDCRAINYQPHPIKGWKVILTVAHVDHDKENNAPKNLRAWCQLCHLTYDAQQHADTRRKNREQRLL